MTEDPHTADTSRLPSQICPGALSYRELRHLRHLRQTDGLHPVAKLRVGRFRRMVVPWTGIPL